MKYLIVSRLHQMGETDSESVIVCEQHRAEWFNTRPNAGDICKPADSDCPCDYCAARESVAVVAQYTETIYPTPYTDCAHDELTAITNKLDDSRASDTAKLSSTERRALWKRGVDLYDAIQQGETACEQLLKGK